MLLNATVMHINHKEQPVLNNEKAQASVSKPQRGHSDEWPRNMINLLHSIRIHQSTYYQWSF